MFPSFSTSTHPSVSTEHLSCSDSLWVFGNFCSETQSLLPTPPKLVTWPQLPQPPQPTVVWKGREWWQVWRGEQALVGGGTEPRSRVEGSISFNDLSYLQRFPSALAVTAAASVREGCSQHCVRPRMVWPQVIPPSSFDSTWVQLTEFQTLPRLAVPCTCQACFSSRVFLLPQGLEGFSSGSQVWPSHLLFLEILGLTYVTIKFLICFPIRTGIGHFKGDAWLMYVS